MNNNVSISASIIASDLSRMGEITDKIDSKIVDYLHVDVMDGHFVPNLTIGPGYINNLKNNTVIPLDVHLMIEKPEDSIQYYIKTKPWAITIHYESTRFPVRLLKLIRESGIIAGVAINPSTPVEQIFDLIQYTDMVLLMSVDPGFYGQSFLDISLDKIRKLYRYKITNGFEDLIIQVDGGINKENIAEVVKAGVRLIVSGSSAFKNGDVNKNTKDLKLSASITV